MVKKPTYEELEQGVGIREKNVESKGKEKNQVESEEPGEVQNKGDHYRASVSSRTKVPRDKDNNHREYLYRG